MKLETGIERPIRRHGNAKYPLKWMGLDESFFVPGGNVASMRRHCSRMGTYYGRGFQCAEVAVDGVAGVRVWRVK